MPWTDVDPQPPRSRDEVLAEVLRQGGRLRRRRRTAGAMAATVAVLVPVVAFVAAGGRVVDHQVSLTAAGPGPGPSVDLLVPTTVADLPTGVDPAPAVTVAPLIPTTTPAAGPAGPAPTTAVTTRVDIDDPIVRPARPVPTSLAAGDGTSTAAASPTSRLAPVGIDPAPPTTLATCPVSLVKVTVATDKATYAPGETVRWTSTLTNASATTCAVSGRAFFHVEDATGATVGSFPHTADYQLPVRAEPGRTLTSSFSWDQTNCANGPCVKVSPGTYTVVAEWTEAAPYVGKGSFGISG